MGSRRRVREQRVVSQRNSAISHALIQDMKLTATVTEMLRQTHAQDTIIPLCRIHAASTTHQKCCYLLAE